MRLNSDKKEGKEWMRWMEGKEESNKASESSPVRLLARLQGHLCLARASVQLRRQSVDPRPRPRVRPSFPKRPRYLILHHVAINHTFGHRANSAVPYDRTSLADVKRETASGAGETWRRWCCFIRSSTEECCVQIGLRVEEKKTRAAKGTLATSMSCSE